MDESSEPATVIEDLSPEDLSDRVDIAKAFDDAPAPRASPMAPSDTELEPRARRDGRRDTPPP
jgi:hypothetical protein